ncbi:hypothetical protein VB638_01190 [Dolichospermum sp. UHCC 0684]|jgi:hypothetical protein|uniref:Uncharacterized protein n=2 Tax=Aphanizomenonaceae TaxID=1892259 RepID=A0A6H2C674_DOLFA|nr:MULTISPECIES: hypothetical protein [Nostocales]MBO1047830.1 hypothetical protein [Dolichospermum sp. DEX182a]MBO1052816.1 hypothetical protein [Dolichospermum sp. DET73]MBO1056716.1 hypothetical protein [Dolichospermum sp. JUN01]MBS9386524.1 hypothetical protein [Dolichospermum sp. BR01]MBS9393660.1 hypothetical protein [Dolichospermum sp. OL01]MCO5797293.1 hypothetical protein [Dolichospermum sp. OL03]MCS6282912.1 hypothetical protein [Dolichospermum sp.]OBQ06965.1 MAG: hypothetical pro
MTLAEIQTQIKNQVAKIEEQQQALLDSQKELSLLLEKKKIMEQVAYKKIKAAVQLLREAQADLEFTNEDILDITKSKMISPEGENDFDIEEYNQNSLILGSIEIDLEKSELSIAEGQKELVNALTEKLDDFEFALSCLPVEERDCARVKLQSIIGNFVK